MSWLCPYRKSQDPIWMIHELEQKSLACCQDHSGGEKIVVTLMSRWNSCTTEDTPLSWTPSNDARNGQRQLVKEGKSRCVLQSVIFRVATRTIPNNGKFYFTLMTHYINFFVFKRCISMNLKNTVRIVKWHEQCYIVVGILMEPHDAANRAVFSDPSASSRKSSLTQAYLLRLTHPSCGLETCQVSGLMDEDS